MYSLIPFYTGLVQVLMGTQLSGALNCNEILCSDLQNN